MSIREGTLRVNLSFGDIDRLRGAFVQFGDAIRRLYGLPTSDEIAMQQRIDRHMDRCARRRERRRKAHRVGAR